MLTEDLESKLLRLAPRHEENPGDSIRDLTRVAARRRSVPPLRERRADLGQSLLGRISSNAVVGRDGHAHALGLGSSGSGRGLGELEDGEGEDLGVEAAALLGGKGALVGDGGELVHAGAGDVEVFGDVLRGPAHAAKRGD